MKKAVKENTELSSETIKSLKSEVAQAHSKMKKAISKVEEYKKAHAKAKKVRNRFRMISCISFQSALVAAFIYVWINFTRP